MSCEYRVFPRLGGDGRWVHDLSTVEPLKADDGTTRPFTLNFFPRIPVRPKVFLTGKLEPNADRYAEFKTRETNFFGFVTLEWVNDAVNPLFGGGNLVNNRRKEFSISQEELAEVRRRDEYVHCYDDRNQFTTNLLRKTYDRIVEYCQNDPGRLWIGEGSFCADHLCGDWGAGGLAFETSRNYCFWQIQMMFCRGAARQYELPWYWYVASFFLGYNSDGKWSGKGNQNAFTPDSGLSRSAVRRATYMTWLSGATCYQREGMEHAFYRPGTHELADEGRIYDQFWQFVQAHRRGVPYQPVALLVPFNRGYTRAGGLAYKRFVYTHADKMLDAVMSTILEWPRNGDRAAAKRGVERVMANSRYGDMFDVLVPNATRRSFFRKAVKNYPMAVLIGDYGDDAGMAADLKAYVDGGGTLVINRAQLTDAFAWVRGGAAVAGTGKGRCIVIEEPYWCPWQEGETPETGVNILGVTTTYPGIAAFFESALSRMYPFRVAGDVQYGFNRLEDGWQVYLVNNGGVTKFGDRGEVLEPGGALVTMDIANLPAGVRIVELMTDKTLAPTGGRISLTVPSGDLRIVDVLMPK